MPKIMLLILHKRLSFALNQNWKKKKKVGLIRGFFTLFERIKDAERNQTISIKSRIKMKEKNVYFIFLLPILLSFLSFFEKKKNMI